MLLTLTIIILRRPRRLQSVTQSKEQGVHEPTQIDTLRRPDFISWSSSSIHFAPSTSKAPIIIVEIRFPPTLLDLLSSFSLYLSPSSIRSSSPASFTTTPPLVPLPLSLSLPLSLLSVSFHHSPSSSFKHHLEKEIVLVPRHIYRKKK